MLGGIMELEKLIDELTTKHQALTDAMPAIGEWYEVQRQDHIHRLREDLTGFLILNLPSILAALLEQQGMREALQKAEQALVMAHGELCFGGDWLTAKLQVGQAASAARAALKESEVKE
jgi:hypothetical protein